MEWFYRKILAWAERKIKDCQRHDRLCEHCKRWYSLAGWGQSYRTDDPLVDAVTCGGCGKVTEWFMGSMLPMWASEVKVTKPTPGVGGVGVWIVGTRFCLGK